jgi:hypothetical protein
MPYHEKINWRHCQCPCARLSLWLFLPGQQTLQPRTHKMSTVQDLDVSPAIPSYNIIRNSRLCNSVAHQLANLARSDGASKVWLPPIPPGGVLWYPQMNNSPLFTSI